MGIPERRYISCNHDGVGDYQCLSCHNIWGSTTSAQYMTYCPFCGVRWVGDFNRHRPHNTPRWKWDLFERELHSARIARTDDGANDEWFDAVYERKLEADRCEERAWLNSEEIRSLLSAQERRRAEYMRQRRMAEEDWLRYCPTPKRDAAGYAWRNFTDELPRWGTCAVVQFENGVQRAVFFRSPLSELGTGRTLTGQPVRWYGQDCDVEKVEEEVVDADSTV